MNFIAEMQILKRKVAMLQAKLKKLVVAYAVRYEDLRRANIASDALLKKLDGYDGGVLEPLQEKYKFVCEENVTLQAELDKHRWIPVNEPPKEIGRKFWTIQMTHSRDIVEAKMKKDKKWYTLDNMTGKYLPTHYKPIILPEQALKDK